MIKISDIFNLSKELINQLSFMIDNYKEETPVSEDIPSQTLDDIIDEIKSHPAPDPEPTDDTTDTEVTNQDGEESSNTEDITDGENDQPTNDDSDDSDDDASTSNTGDNATDNTDPEPEDPIKQLIDSINLIIVQINAVKNNARLDGILECNCADTSNHKVIDTCNRLFGLMSQLYEKTDEFTVIYNSDTNINNRSKFIVNSYSELLKFTQLVIDIKSALDKKSYLITVNGPVLKDYKHWVEIEAVNYLTSIDIWRYLDDNIYLSLIDEATQLDLKYAALLKKLVISEFKGFDEYYTRLIEFIKNMDIILSYYEQNYVRDCDISDMLYDPSILAKASAISTVLHFSIPVPDTENA
jgi:hypothetical protein